MKQSRILLLFLVLALAIPFAHAALTTGIVTYFPNDNTTTISNTLSIDLTGRSNASLIGGVLVNKTGKINQSYAFNGSIYMNQSSTTNFNFGTGGYTISLWVNTTSNGIVAFRKGSAPNYRMLQLNGSGNPEWLEFQNSGTSTGCDILSNRSINNGSFHHIVLVKLGGATTCSNTSQMQIWVDGFLSSSTATGNGGTYTSDTAWQTCWGANSNGNLSCGTSSGWVGSMDEIAMWNRSLTSAEVASLYNSGVGFQYPFNTPATGGTINITATTPANNTAFSTLLLPFNITISSTTNYSVSFFVNGTLNQTMNNVGSGNSTQRFNLSFLSTTVSSFSWSVNVSNTQDNASTGTNFFSIDNLGDSINITGTSPANNTQFNILSLPINVTVSSSQPYNLSLFINGTLNQTMSVGASIGTQVFNLTFSPTSIGSYSWYVNASNGFQSESTNTSLFYIDNVVPVIVQSGAIPRADNTSFFYRNFTTNFTFTDANLFSWTLNLSYTNGSTILNYSNYSLTGVTSVNLQQFFDLTPYVGPLMMVLQVADGHTAQDIEFKKVEKTATNLQFDDVKISLEDKTDTQTLGYIKEDDRYKFEFDTKTAELQKEFIVESDQYIHILEHSEYKCHLVMGDKWVDFNEPEITNCRVERISGTKVRVIVNSPTPKSDFNFESIGQLNIVTQNFIFLSLNTTDTWVTPVLAGTITPFQLNVTYNSSFINSTITAVLYVNGSAYVPVNTNFSTVREFDVNVTMPNTAGSVFSYWNVTVGSLTFTVPQRTTTLVVPAIDNCGTYTTRWMNLTLRDELTGNLVNGSINYLFNYQSGNYTGSYSGNETGDSFYDFCMTPNGATFNTTMLIQYSSPGYASRIYTNLSTVVDNVTDLFRLYLLPSSNATLITFVVTDTSNLRIPSVLIQAYEFDVGSNSNILRETSVTDSQGQAVMNLVQYTKLYNFKFLVNNQVVLATSTFPLFTNIYPYVLSFNATNNALGDYLSIISNLNGVITYTNSTKVVSWPYTYSGSLVNQFCLNVTDLNQTYSSQCTTNYSATLSYQITQLNTTYLAFAYTLTNSSNLVGIDAKTIDTHQTLALVLGALLSVGIFFFVELFFGLLSIYNKNVAIVGFTLGWWIGTFLGIAPWGLVGLSSITLFAIVILIVMNRR